MLAIQEKEVYYPESDGKPMAETDVHRDLLLQTVEVLKLAFPEAYVSGNICLYYERGNPKKMISPDALVCLSQKPMQKQVYKAWETNAQLDLVMEFSSQKTRQVDYKKKKVIYADILKVPYYLIFDPIRMHLDLFELTGNGYHSLSSQNGLWNLSKIGLQVGIELPCYIRLFKDGKKILTPSEMAREERAAKERERAAKERERAEKEKERAEKEKERAAKERERAEKEKERAAKERERAEKEKEQAAKEWERAEKEKERAEKEKERAEKERERAEKEKERAAKERERAEKEKEKLAREKAEQELLEIKAQLEALQAKSK